MKMTKKALRDMFSKPQFIYVNMSHAWVKKSLKLTGQMLEGGFILDWGAKGIGFGQITFRQSGKDVRKLKLTCESERMGREFVLKALEHFGKTIKIVE